MAIDLKAVMARAKAAAAQPAAPPTSEPPKPSQELCQCGHPKDAHEPDAEGDNVCDCMILECSCTSYYPTSQIPTPENLEREKAEAVRSQREQSKPKLTPTFCEICEEDPCMTPSECAAERAELKKKKLGFIIPPGTKVTDTCSDVKPPAPPPDPEEVTQALVSVEGPADWDYDMSKCHHLCSTEGCGKWWTHGSVDKCRYPDLVNQGKCPSCLGVTGETNVDPINGFEDGKLTAQAEMKVRNREREICKDMNVEQLTSHIEFLAKQIEALRIKSLETRKMRAEIEEEQAADLPEGEREKFIQALRQGKAKGERKPRKPRAPKTDEKGTGVRLSSYERNIQNLMRTLGKTRAEVEAFLND